MADEMDFLDTLVNQRPKLKLLNFVLFFSETTQTRTSFYLVVLRNLKLAPLFAKHVQHTIGGKKTPKQRTKGKYC